MISTPLSLVDRARTRSWPAMGTALLMAAVLAACGGGGGGSDSTGTTPPPPAGTSSFTSGAITGFGSVIVNGVRFDDSGAEVVDDDGQRHERDELRLGEQVEIEASSIDRASGQGVATRIRFGSEMVGPVASIDGAAQTLVVLGQTVAIGTATVFDDDLAGGFSGLTVGQVVEVHAQFDAAQGVYRATRIETEDTPAAYKLRGLVEALDAAGRTFRIGSTVINYSDATDVAENLANGVRVRVTLRTEPVSGQWMATRVQAGERHHGDHDEAEVRGLITAWTSATEFSVNGLPVDARTASFPDGQTGVVLGANVEVEGAIVNDVLVATKVQLEDEHEHEHENEAYELHGAITAADANARTFALRGVTVAYTDATVFRDLSASDLTVGRKVEVKGALSADGTRVDATRISRED
ncbi:DUF5666 domain-containing protein [Ideonella sp. DXS29W]|uniref:DUF5666 domain-containing protein n=1 Tax=Ideonella lacteola TaxID=2984193 RepID=A0ABU9BUK8_9BURK